MILHNFASMRVDVGDVSIHLRHGGKGPPLLLLHGYPQSHVTWHAVADRLAQRYTLVMPDLRGYGDSSKPAGLPDHSNYSKRVMANDLIAVMRALGHESFHVCGHDRGGRVAHRLALDHPDAIKKLMLIDISPTRTMYDKTDQTFATLYYHWFFLIQPQPLPETLIGASAAFYLNYTLGGWGSSGTDFFDKQALVEYARCFCTPEAIHSACEDYRAAASIDIAHDLDDVTKKLACPVRVLWGERGVVGRLFRPVADWQAVSATQVTGTTLPAGHFIPEEVPGLLLDEMYAFFTEMPVVAAC